VTRSATVPSREASTPVARRCTRPIGRPGRTVSGRALGDVVTAQDVATEVVRTLVGSIGLVASVPITTGLAALVASREKPPADPP
jgi:YibE/F-like protein